MDKYLRNFSYTTVANIRQYLMDEEIKDIRNDLVTIAPNFQKDDIEINQDEFEKSNQILFIKSCMPILNIFSSMRSQSEHMSFVYKEFDYVILLIKISNHFPFLMLRLKTCKNIACKNIDVVYEFPIKSIFRKELALRKKYDLILESTGSIQYKLIVYNQQTEESEFMIKVANGRQKDMINDVIGIRTDQIPFQQFLSQMKIIIIKCELKQSDIYTFNNVEQNVGTILDLIGDNLAIHLKRPNSIEIYKLAPETRSLYRDRNYNNMKYLFKPYRQPYKLPYVKLLDANTRMYYVIAQHGKIVMFFKVIAPATLDIGDAPTFGSVFDSANAIIEGYQIEPYCK